MAEQTSFNLDNLMIAAPCPVSWDDMSGDERVRHCAECKLNVYKIDEMSKKEVELLLSTDAASAGKVCVQLYRRADGTILTKDCPKGLARIREFSQRIKRSVAVAFALLVSTGQALAQKSGEPVKQGSPPPEGMRLGGAICPLPVKKESKPCDIRKGTDASKETVKETSKETSKETKTTPSGASDASKAKKADNGSLDYYKQGEHLEHTKQYAKAVEEYQKALGALPATGYDPKFQLKIETALSRVRAKVGIKQ